MYAYKACFQIARTAKHILKDITSFQALTEKVLQGIPRLSSHLRCEKCDLRIIEMLPPAAALQQGMQLCTLLMALVTLL